MAPSAAAADPQGSSAPWVEKYRPESLEDVAAHREIINTSTSRAGEPPTPGKRARRPPD